MGMGQLTCCRICLKEELSEILHFPSIPLSGNPQPQDTEVEKYPLTVMRCESCGHVQLKEVISQKFYQDYPYTPSASPALQEYLAKLAQETIRNYKLKDSSLVVEIGCGTGALLEAFQAKKIKAIGFEPSKDLGEKVRAKGIEIRDAFFNGDTASDIRQADLIIARHVVEHIDDLHGFFKVIRSVLKEAGQLILEVPYLGSIVHENQYYAFFHEHLSYFSLATLKRLLNQYGFHIDKASAEFPEGGSILIHASSSKETEDDRVQKWLEEEAICLSTDVLDSLKDRFAQQIEAFKAFLKGQGNLRFAGYGAAQRGVTLLNLCNVDESQVNYVVDKNSLYRGKVIPGTQIPIKDPNTLLQDEVDGILIFATSYEKEIVNEFASLRNKMISMIPRPHWLDVSKEETSV